MSVAERRMMAKSVIDTDQFVDMPATSQNLYFHLLLRADDDGFLSNVKQVQRMTGNKDDDLKILFAKQYLIPFESGVVVIKHWKIHNYIQKDRYHPSRLPEKEEVEVNNYGEWEKKSVSSVSNMYPDCIQHVSIGKDRLGKDRLGKDRKDIKPSRHRYGEYKNVLLSDADVGKLKNEFPNDWEGRIERLSAYMASTGKSYKNHLATIRNWARMQKERDEKSRAAEVKQFAGNEDEEWKKQDDELHELMQERGWL
jgi:hypothetical protein